MKKIICFFLTILTLSFCFVLNVSAEGFEIADYNYKNFELYKMDLNFMEGLGLLEKQKYIDFYNFFGNELLTETIKIPDNTTNNTIYYLNDNSNYINTIFDKNTLKKPFHYIHRIELQTDNSKYANIRIFMNGSEINSTCDILIEFNNNGEINYVKRSNNNYTQYDFSNVYILLPKTKQTWSGSTSCLSYRYIDGEYKFTKPKDMVKGLSYIIDNITYIVPKEMAMLENVNYSMPYVINYVKIIVNSIFTPTGALYTLAPVAIISIAISVLLLGAYIIKRFSWGL